MAELTISTPNDKQKLFLEARKKYVGFGGARGGGKSWAVRIKAVLLCLTHPHIKVMIIRRTYPELRENHIIPLTEMLHCHDENRKNRLARYNDSQKHIIFPNGSRILFRYCETDKDAERFQGTEVDVLFVDEATHQTEERWKKLSACVRGVNNLPKRIYLTMNPGGVGHNWVKRLFIDKRYEANENPADYVFVQSLVTDNLALMRSNPDYISQLEALPEKLKKAWLHGDWNVFDGQFFEEFKDDPEHYLDRQWTHVIEPFEIPEGWTIYRSFDWGYNHPFSCGWWAVDHDGILYRILELYGCTKTPNEGLKWHPQQVFKEIHRIECEHRWLKGKNIIGVADPAIWNGEYGESIEETASKAGVYFSKGDHERIAGWMQMHYRMAFDNNGYPMMYVFKNCVGFIRTIPSLVYDEHKVEDLDTDGEDHCLVGDTLVLTEDGYKTIKSLVGTEGKVKSHDGLYHSYSDVRLTRKSADVYRLTLEDGTQVTCTDDHRFMTHGGTWVHLKDIAMGDRLKTLKDSVETLSIEYIGKQDVYNMEVEDTHSFVIQGGIISHNCADESRYMCMSRPIEPRTPAEADPYYDTPSYQYLDIPKEQVVAPKRQRARMEVIDG